MEVVFSDFFEATPRLAAYTAVVAIILFASHKFFLQPILEFATTQAAAYREFKKEELKIRYELQTAAINAIGKRIEDLAQRQVTIGGDLSNLRTAIQTLVETLQEMQKQ